MTENDTVTVHRNGMVMVRESYFDRLVKASDKLDALEQAGVDNWGGYGYAMSLLSGDEGEE